MTTTTNPNDLTGAKWFVRYCDDKNHMCMTVVSTKDYGPSNIGQFAGEDDTVAIIYHQCNPLVCSDSDEDPDERDKVARLISAAPSLYEALAEAVAWMEVMDKTRQYEDDPAPLTKARDALSSAKDTP